MLLHVAKRTCHNKLAFAAAHTNILKIWWRRISFIGASDPEATYVTDEPNDYWSVDTTSDPCYDRFMAFIPVRLRASLGFKFKTVLRAAWFGEYG